LTRSERLRLFAAGCLVLLAVAGSWNHDLWAYDEPREAELARSIWHTGNVAYLELGGHPFLDKPPLFHASIAASFALARGPSVLFARIATALWALGTIALTAWFARRALGERAWLLAAIVLATTYRFYTVSHEIVLDNALLTFTTAAIVFGHVASRERRIGFACLAALALAGAFLTKGIVGVGLAGLVLALDAAARRDGRGLLVLFHPLSVLVFFAPVAIYFLALWHASGPRSGAFLRELFWANQFGRFLGSKMQHGSRWYLYIQTWPEMLAVWAPVAAVALISGAARLVRADTPPERRDFLRLLTIWAVAPLVVLSFSHGRSRSYALPVLPAYACLSAVLWEDVVRAGALASWARALIGAVVLAGAALVVGAAVAIAVLESGEACALSVGGGALALAVGIAIARGWRRPGFFTTEEAATLASLVVVSGFLVYSGRFVADRASVSRSYRPLAEEVFRRAGQRRICLYHVSNSYSGTFAFYRDRSALEFDESHDPDGRELLADLGPASDDVVLGPASAFDALGDRGRAELSVIWSGLREDDYGYPDRTWAVAERRHAASSGK
jgi:4-amino-4-deoxy-L-arabinose transferase-like glycosyltransferase